MNLRKPLAKISNADFVIIVAGIHSFAYNHFVHIFVHIFDLQVVERLTRYSPKPFPVIKRSISFAEHHLRLLHFKSDGAISVRGHHHLPLFVVFLIWGTASCVYAHRVFYFNFIYLL
jgi:hypothetical protein